MLKLYFSDVADQLMTSDKGNYLQMAKFSAKKVHGMFDIIRSGLTVESGLCGIVFVQRRVTAVVLFHLVKVREDRMSLNNILRVFFFQKDCHGIRQVDGISETRFCPRWKWIAELRQQRVCYEQQQNEKEH